MKQLKCLRIACAIIVACFIMTGCRTITAFDSISFQRCSMLKARILVLMDHAVEPYEKYTDKVDSLMVESLAIYAMDKAREKNENTSRQWYLMLGNKTAILTGFFNLWKQKKYLPDVFIDEAKSKVSDGFDEILKLENAKLKN